MAKRTRRAGTSGDPGYQIQVLGRSVALIDYVVAAGHPVSTRHLANALNLHPSTTYRIVRALAGLDLVDLDQDGRVLPGLKLLVLGRMAERSHGWSSSIAPALHHLAKTTGEIVNLGVLRHDAVFYLEKFEPDVGETALTVRVGQQAPLYCSALGKVFLASMSRSERAEYLARQSLIARTSHTLTTPAALEAEIQIVREQGWAADREEFVDGILCVAAPIRTRKETLAAISITLPTARATPQRVADLVGSLIRTGAELSGQLPHAGPVSVGP